jgi:NAD(P)-dependent dehydrogenase (short-subunit alcohol dehydrogenase family)
MVQACLSAYGRVDILLNNVGGSAAGGPVELAEEAWDAQVAYNLKTVFLTCKHVIPVMEKIGGGAIVNTASTSGLRWTGAAQVGYAASKAGVIHFSRVVAVQYAAKGIRVNTVVPGQMHTPMVEARLADQRANGDVEALLAQRLARIPLGFMGDGRDTAHAALFLASMTAGETPAFSAMGRWAHHSNSADQMRAVNRIASSESRGGSSVLYRTYWPNFCARSARSGRFSHTASGPLTRPRGPETISS